MIAALRFIYERCGVHCMTLITRESCIPADDGARISKYCAFRALGHTKANCSAAVQCIESKTYTSVKFVEPLATCQGATENEYEAVKRVKF